MRGSPYSPTPYAGAQIDTYRFQGILTQVYAWMVAGLLSTGAIAAFVAHTPLGATLTRVPLLYFGLLIGEVALVWVLSANIMKMSGSLATGMFLLYSALNGLTLSLIFMAYTSASIASTFFVTAGTFGVMSLYGYFTRRNLDGIGNLLVMGLIGFLIASVVNLFLANGVIYWITTYLGIIIFVGLTAWDTQKIKRMAAHVSSSDDTMIRRVAIMGALMLYLDFINLFLLLLRILGNRR
ncbi:MAG: Bax inhibitor-1/YccA family protein [Chloroflexaceae bacterium]|nr:Bax inhibitor-1/YccA family protein [Chloroflexaceae bacterium]